ncbi:hypothetical protein BDQ17DRAFT_1438004 [Cyathus striatus]|nr:hypothetical protein BDQ17DRAFT_1438004 [Cyathus striatus]
MPTQALPPTSTKFTPLAFSLSSRARVLLNLHRRIRSMGLVKAGDEKEMDAGEAETPQTIEPPAMPLPETEEREMLNEPMILKNPNLLRISP